MSDRLNLWLRAPERGWLDPADTPLALSTFLVRMAREKALAGRLDSRKIDEILSHLFDLTPAEAADLRQASDICADAAPPLDAFAARMRRHVPLSERETLAHCLSHALISNHADGTRPVFLADLERLLGSDALRHVAMQDSRPDGI